MFDINSLKPEEINLLHNAYGIVNALADRDHMANFAMTVTLNERMPAFHQTLEHAIADAVVDPAMFIAIHALGSCAIQLDDYEPLPHFMSLTDFLFSETERIMGRETRCFLQSWMDGQKMNPENLAAAGSWEKLSMLIQTVFLIELYAGMNPKASSTEEKEAEDDKLSTMIETLRSRALACRGMGPTLDRDIENCVASLEKFGSPPSAGPAAPLPVPPAP